MSGTRRNDTTVHATRRERRLDGGGEGRRQAMASKGEQRLLGTYKRRNAQVGGDRAGFVPSSLSRRVLAARTRQFEALLKLGEAPIGARDVFS